MLRISHSSPRSHVLPTHAGKKQKHQPKKKVDIAPPKATPQEPSIPPLFASEQRRLECTQAFGEPLFKQVVDTSDSIWNLPSKLGLQAHELFEIVLFIETKLHAEVGAGNYYLKKDKTHLARTIEYDPESKLTFIHLKTHGVHQLGKGWHKKVTRSILYDAKQPEIVANNTFMDEGTKEIDTIKKVKNLPGLAHTLAITTHKKDKTGHKVQSVIQKYYNSGTLYTQQYNPTTLSKKEMIFVARDLMQGLESMHENNIVHRDLHGGNMMLDVQVDSSKTRKVSAVLIDLGQARNDKKAKETAPKVQIPLRFNPPESFWRDNTWIDTKKVDVYAMGISLYHLFYRVPAEWAVKEKFAKMESFSDDQKLSFRKKLTSNIEKTVAKRSKKLHDKSKQLKLTDKFAKIILSMCHPDQNKRPSAHDIREQLDALITKNNL